jgi:hypothetical protein
MSVYLLEDEPLSSNARMALDEELRHSGRARRAKVAAGALDSAMRVISATELNRGKRTLTRLGEFYGERFDSVQEAEEFLREKAQATSSDDGKGAREGGGGP